MGDCGMLKLTQALLIAALVAFPYAFAFTQELTPSTGLTSQPEQARPEIAQQPAADDQKATAQPPIIVNVHPAPKTEAERGDEARERLEKAAMDGRLVDYTGELANFTAGLFYATVVLAVATFGLLLTAIFQFREIRASMVVGQKAAEAAKKSADASLIALRPWLSCKVEITDSLFYTEDGDAIFAFKFIVKNVGRSPAMGVGVYPRTNLMSSKHDNSILLLKRKADQNRSLPVDAVKLLLPGGASIGGAEVGLMLFPEETYTYHLKMPIKRQDIENACEDMADKYFFPEVLGLVTYTYPLATIRADTGFVYGIRKEPDGDPSGTAFKLNESVPLRRLSLTDHPLWSSFAT
jgi:hypothetical protein